EPAAGRPPSRAADPGHAVRPAADRRLGPPRARARAAGHEPPRVAAARGRVARLALADRAAGAATASSLARLITPRGSRQRLAAAAHARERLERQPIVSAVAVFLSARVHIVSLWSTLVRLQPNAVTPSHRSSAQTPP